MTKNLVSEPVSRRSLVATAVVGCAAALVPLRHATAAEDVAESTTLDGVYPDDGTNIEPVEVLSHDVVICGTGAAGITAAVHAGELGLDAVVVEPLAECALGGAGNHAEGMGVFWNDDAEGTIAKTIPNSDLMYSFGLKSIDETLVSVLDYHKNMCNANLVRTTLERSVDMFWWMTDKGVKWVDPETATEKYEGTGTQCNNTLYQAALGFGIPFIWNTAGERLIMKDGSVAGILCQRQNGDWVQIDCKAVVMCTGGYLANKELFEKYTYFHYDNFLMYGSAGTETGAAYKMGEAVGACLHHPENIMYCGPIIPGHYNKSKLTVCCANDGTNIWVNETGARFISEDNANDWAQSSAAGSQWRMICSIFDDAALSRFEDVGPVTGRGGYVLKNQPVEGLRDEVEAALSSDDPNVFKADTLEELAQLMGIDCEGLAQTVEQYNDFVDSGFDEAFGKDPEHLIPCNTAPFYGIRMKIGAYTCAGGLKVDESMRVLDKVDYRPIPGFYACGGDAGGLQGAVYDRKVASGSSQLWSRTGGYYAIEDIANTYLPSLA